MSEDHVIPLRRAMPHATSGVMTSGVVQGAPLGVPRGVAGAATDGATLPEHPLAPQEEEQLALQLATMHTELVQWAATLASRDDAEDIVQEAFLRFWRRRQRAVVAAMDGDIRQYLFGMVRDVAQGSHRLSGRRARTLRRLAGARSAEHATHLSNPFISGVRRWMSATHRVDRAHADPRIARALASCSPTQRQLLSLVHRHGLALHEAAETLRMSASGARAHLARAHARMRAMLDSSGAARSRGGDR